MRQKATGVHGAAKPINYAELLTEEGNTSLRPKAGAVTVSKSSRALAARPAAQQRETADFQRPRFKKKSGDREVFGRFLAPNPTKIPEKISAFCVTVPWFTSSSPPVADLRRAKTRTMDEERKRASSRDAASRGPGQRHMPAHLPVRTRERRGA
ncbi:hypothetical protein CABS01_04178 [Colletotrichum abscissum]|uniref:Uncharacterized protein n=1 Tax=Colletotrichum abscissum TaxID=1671311 RepID=A0A9P9XNC8_9PEZI|nr:uncharacterized protein CABS01_04178 [Colletotrichum abscissum]KAI3556656.1 hypothetical protein CABS02_03097 [Colletotrichum abscissum]KAK1473516.1 hypothetical protein CABS01_04178 [Colletotrichum abscissum]